MTEKNCYINILYSEQCGPFYLLWGAFFLLVIWLVNMVV